MKYKITITLSLFTFLLNSCGNNAYVYPNYDIIKPSVSYKPKRENIKKLLKKYINKPYVWAEEGPYAFDCSGLTYNIYGKMGVTLPRVAKDQAKVGKEIDPSQLAYGDLIFFGNQNKRSKNINHVGIYIANGLFAHASSANKKVIYSNLNTSKSYTKRMKVCKRYLSIDEKRLYLNKSGEIPEYKTTRFTTPWKPYMKIPTKIPS
ncbi:Cell wall-associated hydrolases [hydrothermal vent metagenome]|uniref:Cell wall-associated hydrolases n=1 Tax=hydrothermal vent metagenome TaxID=652676 RepID=A0A1W1EHH4_9ZZZZ